MRILYSIILIALVWVGCSRSGVVRQEVDGLLGREPSLLFHIHQRDQFVSQVINNDFWKGYFRYYPNGNVQQLLRSLPTDKDIWVAYTHQGVYVSCHPQQKDTQSPWQQAVMERLDSLVIEKKTWYYYYQGKQLLISSLKDIAPEALSEGEEEESAKERYRDFYRLEKTTSGDVVANLFLSPKKNKEFVGGLFSESLAGLLGDWTAWDVFMDRQTLQLSGSSLRPADSLSQLPLSAAKDYTLESSPTIPQGATQLEAFAFEEHLIPEQMYFDFQGDISSVTFFSFLGDVLSILHSQNPTETLRYFTILKTESFQGATYYQIEALSDVQSFFALFGRELAPTYIYRNEDDLVFAQKREALQGLIQRLQLKQSLAQEARFAALQEQCSSQTAFVALANLSQLSAFAKKFPALAARYGYAALQLSSQEDFYQLTLTATAEKPNTETASRPQNGEAPQSSDKGMQERFVLTLDKPAQTLPHFVTNHRTGEKEVVVQDRDNQLYLIGHDGKILWKKRLDSPIQGEIHQVDLFRNGFLQLAFNTLYSSYVIDRNGKEVAPFCLTRKNSLLPLQIFDYDHNKDYRFVICEDKRIYLKDRRGEEVKGFEGSRVPEGLKSPPQHMRLGGKDFIVFAKANGQLSILHRNGSVRIPLKQTFDFSENPIVAYKDCIAFTTRDGKLHYIDSQGGMRQENLAVGAAHYFAVQGDTRVVLDGNSLYINQKKISLPYADYARPRLISTQKGLLIAVLDEQNHQLYLFSREGETLPGFPIYALSQADVSVEQGKWLLTYLKDENQIIVTSDK